MAEALVPTPTEANGADVSGGSEVLGDQSGAAAGGRVPGTSADAPVDGEVHDATGHGTGHRLAKTVKTWSVEARSSIVARNRR